MKNLTIVIPMFNESERLSKTFKGLKKGLPSCGLKLSEIIFVNDGSTDNTYQLLKQAKPKLEKELKAKVRIVSYKKNQGKGYAVKRGMLSSDSYYTLFMDADLSTPLKELKKFKKLIDKDADVIIGTRKNGESTVKVPQPIHRQLLGRVFTLLSNIILNTWVTDFTCGFKMFKKKAKNEVFSRSKINRWGYDAEILFIARKLGYEINEKAVAWYNDDRSKVNVFKDAISSFSELVEIRVSHFNFNPSLSSQSDLSLK